MGSPLPQISKFPATCLAAGGSYLLFEAAAEDVAYFKPGVSYVVDASPVVPTNSPAVGDGEGDQNAGSAPPTSVLSS